MGQDDPEKRIAELERQLAEAVLRDPTRHALTPQQVHNMAFSKPPIGQRGYNADQVDAFLDSVEIELTRRADQVSQQGAFPPPPQAGFPPPVDWRDLGEKRRLAALADPWPGQKTRFRRIISWFINAELESPGNNSSGG